MNIGTVVRYLAFLALFALVGLGLVLRSYGWLAGIVIIAILAGAVLDKWENRPSDRYKSYNKLHPHAPGSPDDVPDEPQGRRHK